MDELLATADVHGLAVIEDAAHAVETRADGGRKVGAIGDATCFSFYANKNLAAGEGGMLTLRDDEFADRVRSLRLHGLDRDAWKRYKRQGPGPLRRRRAGLQVQPLRPPRRRRARTAAPHRGAPRAPRRPDGPLRRGPRRPRGDHARRSPARARARCTPTTCTSYASTRRSRAADRDAYAEALREAEIGSGLHFLAVHELTWYRARNPELRLPHAELAAREVLSLPLSPAHSLDDIDDVIGVLRDAHARLAADAAPCIAPGASRSRSASRSLLLAAVLWQASPHRLWQAVTALSPRWFVAALVVNLLAVLVMTERWRVLLVARGRHEPGFGWLLETTLVALLLGQVLPTAVGGDAVRAIDLSRRTGARAEAISSVLVDKIVGTGALVVLAAAGAAAGGGGIGGTTVLAIELAVGLVCALSLAILLSRRARRGLRPLRPLARRLRVEAPARALYDALHAYRGHPRALDLGLRAGLRRPAPARDRRGAPGARDGPRRSASGRCSCCVPCCSSSRSSRSR